MEIFDTLTLLATPENESYYQIVAMWLAILSLITFILSLILLPYLIRRIPSDYFLQLSEDQPKLKGYNIKAVLFFLIRNIFGSLLLFCGITMLFLPGQGLLTIFISLLLVNFPGKKRLIRWLTSQKTVRHTVNWVRKKSHKKPINWPPEP